ncbi:MAG: glucuronate isomerase [Verrucomicrobiota bacterium]
MSFISDDFLLMNDKARELYHEYAEDMPIIDYHCHLKPSEIAENKRWENISQIWLYGDHYKWRAMRSNGIDENQITGNVSDREKFSKWAQTVPYLLRNPLYHWTHLELKRYFGIDDLLSPATEEKIWNTCNERLADENFCARGLMKQSNVVAVCTTDNPTDDLAYHRSIAEDESFDVAVLPAWRPDKAMAVGNPTAFVAWLKDLEKSANINIATFDAYLDALRKRHDYFHENGCRLSDHGMEAPCADQYTAGEIEKIFDTLRSGRNVSDGDARKFASAMLYELCLMNAEKGWAQQYHMGAMRQNNTRMSRRLGPDTGFDSISDKRIAEPLSRILDRLDSAGRLSRTILYNLNPRDNAVLATMIGNFQDPSVPGKMQFGSGWWFMDQKDGIERQIESLSQMGLLSRFVGMLTDSRSFLSYPRHDYFRRILCNILGEDLKRGLIPDDMEMVGNMVRDICYNNASRYFDFGI